MTSLKVNMVGTSEVAIGCPGANAGDGMVAVLEWADWTGAVVTNWALLDVSNFSSIFLDGAGQGDRFGTAVQGSDE